MSFSRVLALSFALLATPALAQTEPAPATVTPAPEAAAAPATELTEASGPAEPGDAKRGEAKAAACGACHGADGNSSDPQYPKLAGQHEHYIARQLGLFKAGTRPNPIMLGFSAPLSPQDMRDIGAFFASKTVLPGMADDSKVTEGPNEGKRFYQIGESLYRGGDPARGMPACIGCHGPAGAGNPGPAYPSIGGQHAKYSEFVLKTFRDNTQPIPDGDPFLVMAKVTEQLTDDEIRALASYLEGLHPSPGTAGGK